MLKVIVIDDEASMRANLKALFEKYIPDVEVVGEAEGVQSGLKLLSNLKADVLFLDVEMKDGTGFDLLSQYGPPDFKIIFVTGYDQYAIKAFKFSAVDYLIKPVDPHELIQATQKATDLSASLNQQKIENLVQNNQRSDQEQTILLKDLEAVYLVKIKDIVRCESENNYTTFSLIGGRKLTISTTLKEYERLLDQQGFFRSHQSHLINLAYFDRYEKKHGSLIHMKDGSIIPLSNRKKDFLLDWLKGI